MESSALGAGDVPAAPPPASPELSWSTASPASPGYAPKAFRGVAGLVDRYALTPDANNVVFVMVGLPARGKSFISMRLARFLAWIGIETRVFNVGNHRRTTETGQQDASYFDPQNAGSVSRRDQLAFQVIDDMLRWLEGAQERFAVFDATNTTRDRRQAVMARLQQKQGLGVIFIESICTDAAVLEANLLQKLTKSPDYAGKEVGACRRDLERRVSNYEQVYEPLDEETMDIDGREVRISYIKLLNLSSHVVAHNIFGRASMPVLPYLMSLHIGSRPIWMVRLPHSEDTAQAWRSSKATWPAPTELQFSEQPLSPSGRAFADALSLFAAREQPGICAVCCSHRRGVELGDLVGHLRVRAALNPQDRGAANGLPAKELEASFPEVWADPLGRRFPGGESLSDVMQRLTPLLVELEQDMRPLLLVAPLSALQVLYCYYTNRPVREALTVKLPMHTLIQFQPDGANFVERRLLESDFL